MKPYYCFQCGKEVEMTVDKKFNSKSEGQVFCSDKCYNSILKVGKGKYNGFCKVCGNPFKSVYGGKIYCGIKCYSLDPEKIKRLRKLSFVASRARLKKLGIKPEDAGTIEIKCAYCGKSKIIKKSKISIRNYCNHTHYRKYMADRFDRWIASPQSVALPQNYDEFLTQEVLPCPIEGCKWKGLFLSAHANREHGIPAIEFKKLVGFNLTSGLVTPELSKIMSQNAIKRGAADDLSPEYDMEIFKRTDYRSLEGKEHRTKTMILLSKIPTMKILSCKYCGKPVEQPYLGRKLYCSLDCRSKYYKRKKEKKNYKLFCWFCGKSFVGNLYQKKRNDLKKVIVCSLNCRNSLNFKDHIGTHTRQKGYETNKKIRDEGKRNRYTERKIKCLTPTHMMDITLHQTGDVRNDG